MNAISVKHLGTGLFTRQPLNNRGLTMLTTIIAIQLAVMAIFFLSQALTSARKDINQMNDKVIATAYATELLEVFRGMTTKELKAFLGAANPISGDNTLSSNYYSCSHINLLDRNTGKIVNKDPLASLPDNNELDQYDATLKSNRFYQIQLVKNFDLSIDQDKCKYRWREITFYAAGESNPDRVAAADVPADSAAARYRFLVTVGVTWIPKGGNASKANHVVLSTSVPDAYN